MPLRAVSQYAAETRVFNLPWRGLRRSYIHIGRLHHDAIDAALINIGASLRFATVDRDPHFKVAAGLKQEVPLRHSGCAHAIPRLIQLNRDHRSRQPRHPPQHLFDGVSSKSLSSNMTR